METVGYCVRVQALEGYADVIRTMTLVNDYTAMLAMRHTGSKKENPHYHLVIRTDVKPQAMRVRMKKLFPDGKGNQHMAMTQWDGDDKALSYLFHELGPDEEATLIARKGITDEHIERLRAINTDIQAKVAEAKSKAAHTLEEDAYQHFSKQVKPRDPEHMRPQRNAIAAFIYLHALRAGKYPPQPWLARAMTARVMFRLYGGEEDLEERFAMLLASQLYPD